jgi:ATP-dependent Clp protease adapter protein ClpS
MIQTVFDTQKYKANEIMFQIHLKAMQLDAEYEMSGKSIEDV